MLYTFKHQEIHPTLSPHPTPIASYLVRSGWAATNPAIDGFNTVAVFVHGYDWVSMDIITLSLEGKLQMCVYLTVNVASDNTAFVNSDC